MKRHFQDCFSNSHRIISVGLLLLVHFVMLLDDIWWIGEIGGWELRRVAAVMRSTGYTDGGNGQWWPESMYRIRDEVEKHRH